MGRAGDAPLNPGHPGGKGGLGVGELPDDAEDHQDQEDAPRALVEDVELVAHGVEALAGHGDPHGDHGQHQEGRDPVEEPGHGPVAAAGGRVVAHGPGPGPWRVRAGAPEDPSPML